MSSGLPWNEGMDITDEANNITIANQIETERLATNSREQKDRKGY